jgi:hypothetical protein
LARADVERLPAILAAMDGAGPLAANWIGSAADTVAQRAITKGGILPIKELLLFLGDTNHSPRGRRLVYEWLVAVDPATPERLLPGMLDDPSSELRQDAVARLIDQAAGLPAAEAVARYETALAAARDVDQIRSVAERLEKLGRKVDLGRQLGCLVRWKVVGPWDNAGKKGFHAVYPPETQTEFSFAESYQGKPKDGKPRTVAWIDHVSDNTFGLADLNKVLGREKDVVAYVAAEFLSDRPRDVQLWITCDDASKIWVNGRLAAEFEVYHAGAQFDQYTARASFRQGRNLILAKVCQDAQTQDWAEAWAFQLRVCDPTGAAVLSTDRAGQKPD